MKYRQNTFVSVGNFICNPLERLGEVIDDIGIVTENDFTYAQTTNAAFVDYVTVTSEQESKIYCMKHSTCQGYVQKVMRDGTIEWQVPKANETATAISKTYTQYEDSVPDYYAYEKVAADNLCGNDDTCVGYYEDTALSKTYNILPFTVEEEGIYVGQNFAVEKDAVKHCAASATCEGVSKVETYDAFVAAEEVILNYRKVTSGAPDLSVTREECQQYATDDDGLSYHYDVNSDLRPKGCIQMNTNQIWYNIHTSSTIKCDSTIGGLVACIQKLTMVTDEILLTVPDQAETYENPMVEVSTGAPTLTVSQSECQAYATNNNSPWGGSGVFTNYPSGCFTMGNVIYNTHSTTHDCSASSRCIQKSHPESSLSCRAYSLQHNYLFWDLVANYAYTEVSSGSPALEGDAYVSKEECEAYASNNWYGLSTNNNFPNGCTIWKGGNFDGRIYYNTPSDNQIYNCGTNGHKCIQKAGMHNMLCHLGNTLQ